MLLKNGADMNVQNVVGDTPLHKASQHNSIESAKRLVSEGIDINILDKMNLTGKHTDTHLCISTLSLSSSLIILFFLFLFLFFSTDQST